MLQGIVNEKACEILQGIMNEKACEILQGIVNEEACEILQGIVNEKACEIRVSKMACLVASCFLPGLIQSWLFISIQIFT